MRMSAAPPDFDPEEIRKVRRQRDAREVFRGRFGLSYHQAAFLAALHHGRGGGMTKREIADVTGIQPETVASAFVRTRHLGVECDGRFYRLNDGLRAACVQELRGEAVRAGAGL